MVDEFARHALLRQAVRADVPGIQRVRAAVRENRLLSRVIADEEVVIEMEATGRGWVVVVDGAWSRSRSAMRAHAASGHCSSIRTTKGAVTADASSTR